MQPNSPQNQESEEVQTAPAGTPAENIAQQPVQASSEPQPQETPTPEPPQDNHKILSEYGSPAFPTPSTYVEKSAKKSPKKLIIIGVAVLLVLLCGVAAYFFVYGTS